MPSNPTDNPYAQAAGTYGDHAQKHTPDQRELEARVLLKSAKLLRDIQTEWDKLPEGEMPKGELKELIDETLKYNRQIWMMFYDTAIENPEGNRPNDLRSNIINLANFIFKRELEILEAPTRRKFDILISINRDIAAGLMTAQKAEGEGVQDQSASTTTEDSVEIAQQSTTDISG